MKKLLFLYILAFLFSQCKDDDDVVNIQPVNVCEETFEKRLNQSWTQSGFELENGNFAVVQIYNPDPVNDLARIYFKMFSGQNFEEVSSFDWEMAENYSYPKTFKNKDQDIIIFFSVNENIYFVKIDKNGEEILSYKEVHDIYGLGRPSSAHGILSVVESENGNYHMLVTTKTRDEIYLLEFSSSGDLINEINIMDLGIPGAQHILSLDNERLIIQGNLTTIFNLSTSTFVQNIDNSQGKDIKILKLDTDKFISTGHTGDMELFISIKDFYGNELLYETYPGFRWGNGISKTEDGGFLITGVPNLSNNDIPYIKFNSDYEEEWVKSFYIQGLSGYGVSINETIGGYLIFTSDSFVIKTDCDGNI